MKAPKFVYRIQQARKNGSTTPVGKLYQMEHQARRALESNRHWFPGKFELVRFPVGAGEVIS